MMADDMALRVVSKELDAAMRDGFNVFHVTFMGGEPFLNTL